MQVINNNSKTNFGIRSIKALNVSDDVFKNQILGLKDRIYRIGEAQSDCLIIRDNRSGEYVVGVMNAMQDGTYLLGATVGRFLVPDLIKTANDLLNMAKPLSPIARDENKIPNSELIKKACTELLAVFKGEKKPESNVVFLDY